ncbi:hypothetical protein [Mycobacteroides abscessus]|uniref:hypothetical protein n=1 Tax=Mycobacteroides abscessus TaxID=36809 RepID=UPI0019D1481E|nr:hypothetical protein [Mycobacteroides abscessus]MBN7560484.1 hypothetical protein [Mycobacteroides abscessus subsp. abscessus]
MPTELPSTWSYPDSDLGMSPLIRIVWMGESGVNEELLNDLIGELAALATAAQNSRYATVDAGLSGEALQAENDAEEQIRVLINKITRILVDPIKVHNKEHNETFEFRFGQCIRFNSLQDCRAIISLLRNSLSTDPVEQHWDVLKGGRGFLEEWQAAAIPPALLDLRKNVLNSDTYDAEISAFLQDQITAAQMANLDRIEQSAVNTLKHIDTAAGKVGSKSLAKGFVDQRNKEGRRARWWTGGVVASIASGIGLPALILTTDELVFTELDGTTGMIIKALVGLPMFALAAYCGRISSQHRETERYLSILATQIDTVQAYADQLPESYRPQMIIDLGKRAFADPGFPTVDKGKAEMIPDDVMQLLNKALDIAKNSAKGPQQT